MKINNISKATYFSPVELEFNADGLDDSIIDSEEFSGFRLFGVGKPSKKQLAKWMTNNPEKINDLINKGIIDAKDVAFTIVSKENSLKEEKENGTKEVKDKVKLNLKDNPLIADAIKEITSSAAINFPNTDNTKNTTDSTDVKPNFKPKEISTIPKSTPSPKTDSKKILGMSMNVGVPVIIVASLAIGFGVYKLVTKN